MSLDHSVSHWVASLKAGDSSATQLLWTRYKDRLVELARHRLDGVPKRTADEDDVAQSVFISLCRGATAGRFEQVTDRDELWWLLLALTRRKVVDLIRRENAQKRGAGRVFTEQGDPDHSKPDLAAALDQLMDDEPTPDFLVMMEEQHRRLLGLLRDDRLREIAEARIEGYSISEIASRLSVSTRSVERKMRLIREAWIKELTRAD